MSQNNDKDISYKYFCYYKPEDEYNFAALFIYHKNNIPGVRNGVVGSVVSRTRGTFFSHEFSIIEHYLEKI